MKSKTQLVAVGLALVLISLIAAPRVLAQHPHDQNSQIVWKTGMVRLSKSAWAGDLRLKSGMYHVKHVMDGTRHVIVFKSVALRRAKNSACGKEKKSQDWHALLSQLQKKCETPRFASARMLLASR